MLFLSAKLGFYHNILNNHMLIQCADLIFKQHDRKITTTQCISPSASIGGESWNHLGSLAGRYVPKQILILWQTQSALFGLAHPQISPDIPSVHTFVTHALPANRMFSGFKSLAENEWWNSDESRHIPKLEMRHSRRFSVTNRTCRHKFPGSIYGS